MYCRNCGRLLDDKADYCVSCGTKAEKVYKNDKPSFWLGLLGFFFPFIGFILYLVYSGNKPRKAKSAGKGALSGFLTGVILVALLYIIMFAALFFTIGDVNNPDYYLEKYVDVTFGEFTVIENSETNFTSLEVTIKNKSDEKCSYSIEFEAVNQNGDRLGTDSGTAAKLNAGQSAKIKIFQYIAEDEIDDYKDATFKVLEIDRYSY